MTPPNPLNPGPTLAEVQAAIAAYDDAKAAADALGNTGRDEPIADWLKVDQAIVTAGAGVFQSCLAYCRTITTPAQPAARGVVDGLEVMREELQGYRMQALQQAEKIATHRQTINELIERNHGLYAQLTAALSTSGGAEAAGDGRVLARLQQQCSDWGAYWRAPDAHGVILSVEQAHELLRDALGVEVEITPPPSPEAAENHAVGCLTISRFRGVDAMVNHDFDYFGNLPDGSHSLYTAPPATSQPEAGDGDAFRALAAWDAFCLSHPGKYPTDEELKQRELLHSVLSIKAIEFLRNAANAVSGGGKS